MPEQQRRRPYDPRPQLRRIVDALRQPAGPDPRILRQALQHIEQGRLRAMSKITDRPDGMSELHFSPLKMALHGSEVPDFVLLRAKCPVELIEQTHLKIWVNRAVSNSHAIWKLFSGDADLRALAAQPFLLISNSCDSTFAMSATLRAFQISRS